MSNIFNIKITAVDNATKVVNKINKSVAKIFAPYDKAKQSAGSFLNAVGKNDLIKRSTATLNSFGQSISNIGTSFGIAENSVMASSARIGLGLMGIGGPLGALAGGAVVAAGAITAVTVKMAKGGQNIDYMARSLDMSTGSLQSWRAAAERAGGTSEAMDASLQSLSSHLVNAKAGLDPDADRLLAAAGIKLQLTKSGAVDVAKAMMDISEVMSKMRDPNQQKLFADAFGLGEQIPLLRQGKKAIEEKFAEARRAGQVQSDAQIQQNAKEADSWNNLKGSVGGLATTVGNLIGVYGWLDRESAAIVRLTNKLNGKVEPEGSWGPSRESSGKITDMTAGPLGIRNNNPGNLRSWQGAGTNGGFATFPTANAGLTAAAKNLLAYKDKYGIDTVNDIVSRWAPSSDHNNVPAYVNAVTNGTGFGANQALNMRDPSVLAPLLSSIVKHENGQNPYSAQEIGQAVAQALKESQSTQTVNVKVEGLPAGATVKQSRAPASTGLAMADGGAF